MCLVDPDGCGSIYSGRLKVFSSKIYFGPKVLVN